MNDTLQTRHYPVLDGLRGIAALAVVGYHVALYFQLPYLPFHAYLAVDFFFMLSGYVISFAYDRRLARIMDFRGFILVRAIRLYPLAVLGVGMGTVALLLGSRFGDGISMKAVLEAGGANALLLPTTALLNFRLLAFPTDSPLWSLAFEVWINLLYGLFFRLMNRQVLTSILIAGALCLVWAALSNNSLNIGFFFNNLYLGAVRVVFPFVGGVLIHRVLAGRGGRLRLAHAMFLPLILVLIGPSFNSGVYDAAAVLIAFPTILYVATLAPAAPALERLWSALGAISYPLYALHFPLVVVVSNVVHKQHWQGTKLYAASIGTYVIALLLATLALHLYDTPVRRLLTRRLSRDRTPIRVAPQKADA